MIRIHKIDLDTLGSDKGKAPDWAWITATVNGVEARYRLTDEQIATVLESVTPILMEQVRSAADILTSGNVVVEIRKVAGPAA